MKDNPDPLKIELSNLDADIGESRDVAGENAEVVENIRQLMVREAEEAESFKFRVID